MRSRRTSISWRGWARWGRWRQGGWLGDPDPSQSQSQVRLRTMPTAAQAATAGLAGRALTAPLHHLVMPGTLFRGENRIHLLLHGIAHGLPHGLAGGLLDFQNGPDLGLLFWIQSQHGLHPPQVGIHVPAWASPAGTTAPAPHGGTRLHHAAIRRPLSLTGTKTTTGLRRDTAGHGHQAQGTGNEGHFHLHGRSPLVIRLARVGGAPCPDSGN